MNNRPRATTPVELRANKVGIVQVGHLARWKKKTALFESRECLTNSNTPASTSIPFLTQYIRVYVFAVTPNASTLLCSVWNKSGLKDTERTPVV